MYLFFNEFKEACLASGVWATRQGCPSLSASGRRLTSGSGGEPMHRRLRRMSTPSWCGHIGYPRRAQALMQDAHYASNWAVGALL
jgi:hypothetical protein